MSTRDGAPLVDTRSVSKATVISQEVLSALPTAKSVGSMLAFVPGAVSPANGVDTGGTLPDGHAPIAW